MNRKYAAAAAAAVVVVVVGKSAKKNFFRAHRGARAVANLPFPFEYVIL